MGDGFELERVDRKIDLRYKLAEPLQLEQGRWIPRYDGPHRGYWLAATFTEVQVLGRWDHDVLRFWAYAKGRTTSKAGRPSRAQYERAFHLDRPETPELINEIIRDAMRRAAEPAPWPVEGAGR